MAAYYAGAQPVPQKQTFSDADAALRCYHTWKKFDLQRDRKSYQAVNSASQLHRASLKTHTRMLLCPGWEKLWTQSLLYVQLHPLS